MLMCAENATNRLFAYCAVKSFLPQWTQREQRIFCITAPAGKKFTEPGALAPVLPHRALFVL